jgi:hypothetical protein
MKKYNSKIGNKILLVLIIVFGGISILMILTKTWLGLAAVILMIGFVGYVFLTTYYSISDQMLKVKCGFMVNKSIPIDSIIKISETNNPVSAPANSMDRLEIEYGAKDSILISPKDKVGFINHILSINHKIESTIDNNEL